MILHMYLLSFSNAAIHFPNDTNIYNVMLRLDKCALMHIPRDSKEITSTKFKIIRTNIHSTKKKTYVFDTLCMKNVYFYSLDNMKVLLYLELCCSNII